MGNILVLGAGGFIGSQLAVRLLADNRVIGYSRHAPGSLLAYPNYEHIIGDFSIEDRFPIILKSYQISCIYHCISTTVPQVGTGRILTEVQENLLPTLKLLEAVASYGVCRIVFVSSGGTVYGEQLNEEMAHTEPEPLHPICGYGAQKVSIEAYLNVYRHVHSMNVITVRVSNPYGYCHGEKRSQGIIPIFLKALYEGRGIVLFGDTVRDYIYIDDVVDALIRMKDYCGEGRVFNIGSGQGIRLHQLVRMIERLTQKRFCSVRHEPIRDCDVRFNVLDAAYAQRELGWEPQTGLENGIRGICERFEPK